MLALALAALLTTAQPAIPPVQAVSTQTATTGAQVPSAGEPVDLEDIVVSGRRLEDATQTFVREVGAPSRNRGLARWRGGVCVGVANLQNETAQFIVDRVSDVARDVGLRSGAPGCTPSVIIVATQDAKAFTPQFIAQRPRLFMVGGTGMDRGRSALEAFKNSDLPVRWWHVSVPVDEAGQIAVRIPGQCANDCTSPTDMAPQIAMVGSHLQSSTEDDLKRVFIIVDVDKVANVSLEQLADYLAMVTLAQVNPEADTSGYSTILNVFNTPEDTPALTNWDRAYLKGLYESQRTRASRGAARQEVVSSIIRVRQGMAANEATD